MIQFPICNGAWIARIYPSTIPRHDGLISAVVSFWAPNGATLTFIGATDYICMDTQPESVVGWLQDLAHDGEFHSILSNLKRSNPTAYRDHIEPLSHPITTQGDA